MLKNYTDKFVTSAFSQAAVLIVVIFLIINRVYPRVSYQKCPFCLAVLCQ